MGTITVTAEELHYLDLAANHDKFYRTYAWATTCAVQYGRGGTAGTFKRTEFPTPEAALAAATKQANSKFSKGYERIKSARLEFDHEPNDGELDTAMNRAPLGGTPSVAATSHAGLRDAAVVRLNAEDVVVDATIMPAVVAALTATIGPARHQPAGTGTAVRPMLAETLPADQLDAHLADDRFVVQRKVDGDRFVVEVVDGSVAVYNRQGVPKTSNVAEALLAPFRHLTGGRFVVDGEVVGRTLVLFDMIEAGGHIGRDTDFVTRHAALTAVMSVLGPVTGDNVVVLPYVAGSAAKLAALETARAENREGIMFRRAAAAYQPGRRSLDLLKWKFVRELDAFVTKLSTKAGKQNAEVAVVDDDGSTVVLGAVSTIGKGDISVGDVVEVRYLYTVGESTKLFQPRIVRRRSDKAAGECSIRQLDGSATNKAL